VYAPAWHPDEDTELADNPPKSLVIAGVAGKP
jgi:hypothetical protein